MADIAKLFLDGARPAAPGGVPKRMSPKDRAAGEKVMPANTPEKNSALPNHGPTVLLAMAANADWKALTAAAGKLAAESGTTACVMGVQNVELVMQLIGPKAGERIMSLRALTAAGAGAMLDLQIARAIFTVRDAVSLFVIAAPPVDSPVFRTLAQSMPQWLVVCPTDNDGVLATYHLLKRAVAGEAAAGQSMVSAFMLSGDAANAAVVHSRLARAAKEFLAHDLPLAGVAPVLAGATSHAVSFPVRGRQDVIWSTLLDELLPHHAAVEEERNTPVHTQVSASPVGDVDAALDQVDTQVATLAESSRRAAEHMIDTLTHVLDPEEKAALSAALEPLEDAFEEEPAPAHPAYDIRAQISAPVMMKVTEAPAEDRTTRPASVKIDGAPALRAFEFEPQHSSRHAQWTAIERSIRDLVPHSILLDARPPMSWASECVLAVAPEGTNREGPCRLHVWTLYKDGVTWFALREWANEHRNLLALTRRDLTLSRDADVAVHIVLPLEADKGLDATTLLRTPVRNVHVYRLRAIHWNARQGILVVPIA